MSVFRQTEEWLATRMKRKAIPLLTDIVRPEVVKGGIVSSDRQKYGNEQTGKYASKKEARRAADLRLMQEGGLIRNLREQVRYEIIPPQRDPNGACIERSAHYVADFVYDEFADGQWREVVEDVKGVRTREYVLKRKLMLHVHKIRVMET